MCMRNWRRVRTAGNEAGNLLVVDLRR